LVILPSHLYKEGKIATVDSNNILHITTVELFRRDKNNVYISHGLAAGQKVALTKVEHLYEGMEVRLTTDQPADPQDESAALAVVEH